MTAVRGRGACIAAASILVGLVAPLAAPGQDGSAAPERIVVKQPAPNALQEAIDAAAPGDKIRVQRGHYREALLIEKPLKLVGVGKRRPVIDAECQVPNAITVTSPGVTLKGLKVIGAGPHAEVDFLSVASGRTHNLRLRNTCDTEYGINVFGSGALTITANRATGFTDAGIYIGDITNTQGGTLLASGNETDGNNKGIIVEFSAGGDILVENNEVHDNTLAGIGESVGIFVFDSDGARLIGNRVRNNGSVGVHLTTNSNGNVINDNEITGNPTDVRDEGSGNCGSGNTFSTGGPLAPC